MDNTQNSETLLNLENLKVLSGFDRAAWNSQVYKFLPNFREEAKSKILKL